MEKFPSDLVYVRVAHVKTGYEQREIHIREQFRNHGMPINWYLDWDVPDFTDDDVRRLVAPGWLKMPALSCTMKHIGIWRDFLRTDFPFCLVLEDDVFLASDFNAKLNMCLSEFGGPARKAVVYIGNAGNYYISAFKLKTGKHLYAANHSRATDSYLITRPVAQARCDWFDSHQIGGPIGHELDRIDPKHGVEVLWFERPFVEQGTQSGAFKTSIGVNKQLPLWYMRLEWNWKKYRRQLFGHTNH